MNNIKKIGVAQVCQMIGISRRRLNYLQEAGLIEVGDKNFAGHRVYSVNDIESIKRVDQELKNGRCSSSC